MRNRLLSTLLLVLMLAVGTASAAQKEPRVQKVYMFGFGASLTDSLARQTQVQVVDSAWIDAHKLLVDRMLYSIQLQFYLEQNEGMKNPLCTIYFDTNERKVNKLWHKIKKRYESEPTLKYAEVPATQFRFTAEQYRPVITEEPTDAAVKTEAPKQTKKTDKKAAKK